MNKKLTAKTQYLNPILGENIMSFSRAMTVTPDSDELMLKKGTLYAIVSVAGNSAYDPELVSKVVSDVLHESYYQSDNISPTQSLEKAIVDVRDKVLQLSNETISPEEQSSVFSIITAVLWGNVLYVVQYGDAKGYVTRAGEIKPINTTPEGAFAASTGVVKDEDVIILCSSEFGNNYPPERLLTMSIGEQELKPGEACLLMKFLVDTTFTQDEIVDFGIDTIVSKNKPGRVFSSLLERLSALKKPRKIQEEKPETFSIRLKSPDKIKMRFKFKTWMLVPIILTALAVSVFYTVKNRDESGNLESPEQNTVLSETSTEVGMPPNEEVDEEVFYDIKITDAGASPNSIAVFSDYIVVSDKSTGKIYKSGVETPKFEAVDVSFPGITNMINIGGMLGFTDNEGYKVFDLEETKTTESYAQGDLGATSAYTDFVYTIQEDKITRYSKEESGLSGVLWGQSADFKGARSLSVAYSIYVLTESGGLVKFTSGTKEDFQVSGDNSALSDPIQILADIDFDYIYVADKGNMRVAVFDEEGEFIREYRAKKETRWNDMRGIGVSPDEKTLFVLSGTRVYKTALE
ncbi:hypothetical protein C4561_03725 [candidate division WWE3 bacterium]|jgi:cytoskeletal protein RodZ|uniref:PPM-type phosphatase domain-containing protein n=1 Tax=candidate division WWE3 bacterium TaxID=2053526 RepID=A0A3A4ZJ34_UNCKA|nr:MAG: hypothetical protein C4561_03725 [candidate division WWE3 bacterium]